MIERYPTHLIMKALAKVDRKRTYLREAHKFMKREKVHEIDPFLFDCAKHSQNKLNLVDVFFLSLFIPLMQIYWPNIKDEIILMHYLFSSKHQVKESEAILIIILLLDLQEDFRFSIKQSIMRFLLR